MQIQVNSQNQVTVDATLSHELESIVSDGLARFGDRLTRVELHLSDENAHKAGDGDKRCTLEARPAGQGPITATGDAAEFADACRAAVRKLRGALDSKLGAQQDHKVGASVRDLAPE